MLCSACQGIFAAPPTVINTSLEGPSLDGGMKIHHGSREGLKQAVASGCYVCNQFWVSLRAIDRDSVSAWANCDPLLEAETDAAPPGTLVDSATPFMTAYCVENGPPYGHLGWYQLRLAVNMNAIWTSEMVPNRACWCNATFVLQPQPRNGKFTLKSAGPICRI
jgi:hypothetical protein